MRRVHRQIGHIMPVEKSELVVDVPHRLVARRGGEEDATAVLGGEEALQHPVALVVGMAEIVALVHQHHIPIAIPVIVQHPLRAIDLILAQHPHGEDARVELVGFIIVLPHLHQGGGADDEGPGTVTPFEVFENGRADVGFAQADHVGDEAAAITPDHPHRLAHSPFLELGQHGGDVITPQEFLILAGLDPFAHEFVERLEVDLVGSDLGQGPRLAQFLHQMGLELLRFGPQRLEPAGQLGVVGVAVDQDVELGIG